MREVGAGAIVKGGGRKGGGREDAPTLLQAAVGLWLATLPAGHLLLVWVGGARANAAEAVLALVLAVAVLEGVRGRLRLRPSPVHLAVLLLVAFGAWAAASGLWGPHPGYAAAKGSAYVALALGAGAVVASGLRWERAVDVWLLGTALALGLALAGILVGPESFRERMVYLWGAVYGLPFPRLQATFFHPNLLGDYLVVSGALLWARWPAYRARSRWGAWAGAAALALALTLAVPVAWLGAGLLLLLWGRALSARVQEVGYAGGTFLPVALRGAGVVLLGGTLAGILRPLRIELGPLEVATGGIRPRIWRSASEAFLEAPLQGVGAAPYLARAAEPLGNGQPQLWDAHNAYLSVAGQFGAVGVLLVGAALWLVVRKLRGVGREHGPPSSGGAAAPARPSPAVAGLRRVRLALLAALLAVAVNGMTTAGEDFRHWWALVGLCGLVAAGRGGRIGVSGGGPERDEGAPDPGGGSGPEASP